MRQMITENFSTVLTAPTTTIILFILYIYSQKGFLT